jgi:hypothetical protein
VLTGLDSIGYCVPMTKRDFIAIAAVLNANVAPLSLVSDFADMCEDTNERFDRQKFVVAATQNLRAQQEHEARMLTSATKEK